MELLPPYPFYAATTAITHGERVSSLCPFVLFCSGGATSLVPSPLITFGYPGYVNSVWVWGGFLVRRWNLQDKAGAVPILQFIWHIRPFRFGSALRVVLVNNYLASLYLSITHNKCLFCGIPPFLFVLLHHDRNASFTRRNTFTTTSSILGAFLQYVVYAEAE